jgi:aminoglycoside 2'-N-acetyltransferase I
VRIDVRVVTTAQASGDLLRGIRSVVSAAFGERFSDDDWDHTLGGTHVVVGDEDVVVSHAAIVPRTLEVGGRALHTGYVEGVATAPARQGRGLGSHVMGVVSDLLHREEFDMGALSTGNHAFYERLGWERWRGPTFVRHGSALVRSEDDDDGVMVLRFGASANVDLDAPISCEARAGDDW